MSCEVFVNINNQKISHQDCHRKVINLVSSCYSRDPLLQFYLRMCFSYSVVLHRIYVFVLLSGKSKGHGLFCFDYILGC